MLGVVDGSSGLKFVFNSNCLASYTDDDERARRRQRQTAQLVLVLHRVNANVVFLFSFFSSINSWTMVGMA